MNRIFSGLQRAKEEHSHPDNVNFDLLNGMDALYESASIPNFTLCKCNGKRMSNTKVKRTLLDNVIKMLYER